jgi:hypothetical protein
VDDSVRQHWRSGAAGDLDQLQSDLREHAGIDLAAGQLPAAQKSAQRVFVTGWLRDNAAHVLPIRFPIAIAGKQKLTRITLSH